MASTRRTAGALLALAGLAAACGPSLVGTCQSQADCAPSKTYCSVQGVCIAQSGNCGPSGCGPGLICSNSSCTPIKPSISLQPGPALSVGPGAVSAVVRVEAATGLALGPLEAHAFDAAGRGAFGVLAHPVPGDNVLTLSGPGAETFDPRTFAADIEPAEAPALPGEPSPVSSP